MCSGSRALTKLLISGDFFAKMIRINGLKKQYRDSEIPVFDGFNEEIKDGEMIFLTGESGSGKTTLIRILLKEDRT